MMTRRFYVETPITGATAELVGAEARHATKVMRLRSGDELVLFDGSGVEFRGRIRRLERESVTCEILACNSVDRELPIELTLCVALPKGDRQRWLIEKAVELGVRHVIPLTTDRGVAVPSEKTIQRLRRAVVEASKQCGRNTLMEIAAAQSLPQLAVPRSASRLLAHHGGSPPLPGVETFRPFSEVPAIWIAVGPEGGFTDAEVAWAEQAGWQLVSLGPRVLRVETAAVALAAWMGFGRQRENG